MRKGDILYKSLPQGTKDLLDYLDRARDTLTFCRFLREQSFHEKQIESKYDIQAASQTKAVNERRYAPPLTEREIVSYLAKTPIGYFTPYDMGKAIGDGPNGARIVYWLYRAKKLFWCRDRRKYRRALKPTRI